MKSTILNKCTYDFLLSEEELKDTKTTDSWKKEFRNRKVTCYIVEELGEQLNAKKFVISTACFYVHRYYIRHDYDAGEAISLAMAAYRLVVKCNYIPYETRDIIVTCLTRVLHKNVDYEASENTILNLNTWMNRIELDLVESLDSNVKVHYLEPIIIYSCKKLQLTEPQIYKALAEAYFCQVHTYFSLIFQPKTISALILYKTLSYFNQMDIIHNKDSFYWKALVPYLNEEKLLKMMDMYKSFEQK